jgi:hypothetical protein
MWRHDQHRHTPEMASVNRSAFFPTQTRGDPVRERLRSTAASGMGSGRPRVLRMPADWWDSPSSVSCPLNCEPQAARVARRLTRNTLRGWGLAPLAEDAESIVGEFVANAVTHRSPPAREDAPPREVLSLRLIRRPAEVICAVLDPSKTPPAPGPLEAEQEAGRGLHIVSMLSDVWGWSPVAGGGKAVWAILFCA